MRRGWKSWLSALAALAAALLSAAVLQYALNGQKGLTEWIGCIGTGFFSPKYLGQTLSGTAILLLCGLSVGLSYQGGLINTGVASQFLCGTALALLCRKGAHLPWSVSLLAATVGGAAVGALTGLIKSRLRVSEAVTGLLLYEVLRQAASLLGTVPEASGKKNPRATLPALGLKSLTGSVDVDVGLIAAVVCALIIWFVLAFTVRGYETRLAGRSEAIGRFGGLKVEKHTILLLLFSGALAGMAGGICRLSALASSALWSIRHWLGFRGFPVAFLASAHPLGALLSAFVMSGLQTGAETLKTTAAQETAETAIAVTLYAAAFFSLLRQQIKKPRRASAPGESEEEDEA